MEGESRGRIIVIDTYALLAMAYGEVSDRAAQALQDVRRGRIVGVVPVTVAYEYLVHWHRGRIPVLKTVDEVTTFLTTYFRVESLTLRDWITAAEIKHRGDNMLKTANEPLRSRRLSIVDSTVIACALKLKAPILTGDEDLAFVAENLGITVIW